MNIQTDKTYMVFKKEGQYGPMYSIGVSKKNQDNSYTNGYIPVRFRKDIELEDRTNIYIKKAWLDFYLTKDKKTSLYIFINEYETVEKVIEESKEEKDQFQQFSEEITLTSADLPF